MPQSETLDIADEELELEDIPLEDREKATDIINKFMADINRHPDSKLVSMVNGGTPDPQYQIPHCSIADQRIMVIKLVYRYR